MDERDSIVEMDPAERDRFLGNGGVGVISLSTTEGERPYTVPVSYGYDASEGVFYFRLATGSEHAKGELRGRVVSFVVHGREDGWRSVVAGGRLEATDEEAVATETLAGLDRVEIPLVEMFEEPTRTVSFEFVRLVPEEIHGRRESPVVE